MRGNKYIPNNKFADICLTSIINHIMKILKRVLLPLLTIAMIALGSCSKSDDDNIDIHAPYIPPTQELTIPDVALSIKGIDDPLTDMLATYDLYQNCVFNAFSDGKLTEKEALAISALEDHMYSCSRDIGPLVKSQTRCVLTASVVIGLISGGTALVAIKNAVDKGAESKRDFLKSAFKEADISLDNTSTEAIRKRAQLFKMIRDKSGDASITGGHVNPEEFWQDVLNNDKSLNRISTITGIVYNPDNSELSLYDYASDTYDKTNVAVAAGCATVVKEVAEKAPAIIVAPAGAAGAAISAGMNTATTINELGNFWKEPSASNAANIAKALVSNVFDFIGAKKSLGFDSVWDFGGDTRNTLMDFFTSNKANDYIDMMKDKYEAIKSTVSSSSAQKLPLGDAQVYVTEMIGQATNGSRPVQIISPASEGHEATLPINAGEEVTIKQIDKDGNIVNAKTENGLTTIIIPVVNTIKDWSNYVNGLFGEIIEEISNLGLEGEWTGYDEYGTMFKFVFKNNTVSMTWTEDDDFETYSGTYTYNNNKLTIHFNRYTEPDGSISFDQYLDNMAIILEGFGGNGDEIRSKFAELKKSGIQFGITMAKDGKSFSITNGMASFMELPEQWSRTK